MNSQKIFRRMKWNFFNAIGIVLIISLLAVGAVFAAGTTETSESPTNTKPQSPLQSADFGDLPDNSGGASFTLSYDGLTLLPTGAFNVPATNGVLLGSIVDNESDGFPDADAVGDDLDNLADEDGVERDMTVYWTNGATVPINVTVNGCSGTCYLNGWIDWGRDGSFAGDQIFSNEAITSNGVHSFNIIVPELGDYTEGDDVYARFRICDSAEALPNGCNSLTGFSNNGEVEDYFWEFGPTAVELVSIEATTNYAVPFALLAGALILLFSGGAILAFKRNRA